MQKGWLVGALLAGLAACQTVPMTVDAVKQNTKVSYDPYDKMTTIEAPQIGLAGDTQYHLTRSYRFGMTLDMVSLAIFSSRWVDLYEAVDIDGVHLSYRNSLHTRYGRESVGEVLSIPLPEGYLQKHAASGLNIRVYGKRGQETIVMPPAYVQGFLAAVAQVPLPR